MELPSRPYVRTVALVVAAFLSFFYAVDAFQAGRIGGCWALPGGLGPVCDAAWAAFLAAAVALFAGIGTLWAAVTLGAGREPAQKRVRRGPSTPRVPRTEAPDGTTFRATIEGRQVEASSLEELEALLPTNTILDSGRLGELLKNATTEFSSDFIVQLDGKTFRASSLDALRDELRKHTTYDDAKIEAIVQMLGKYR